LHHCINNNARSFFYDIFLSKSNQWLTINQVIAYNSIKKSTYFFLSRGKQWVGKHNIINKSIILFSLYLKEGQQEEVTMEWPKVLTKDRIDIVSRKNNLIILFFSPFFSSLPQINKKFFDACSPFDADMLHMQSRWQVLHVNLIIFWVCLIVIAVC